MPKVDPLLRSKLRLPANRPELVVRARLQDQLAHGLRLPLTLVTAPAGYGKTTLVAACLADCGLPVAWLALDKQDNQPGRFLIYLVAALQTVDPGLGNEAAQLAYGPQPPQAAALLTSLLNDLEAASRPLVLVLDDYQFISNRAVHEAVAFLVEHSPPTFHLVIVSRSDPPLPLARLRAHAQLVELRSADLSFTEPEAGQFLNGSMGLALDGPSVAALAARTEGWIVGLQLAALSLRQRQDIPEFIAGFSGTHRYILDYLVEEVLSQQAPAVKRFLLCTSILERLCVPLCEAVLDPQAGLPGSAPPSAGSSPDLAPAAVLEYLEHANLFLIALDDGRQWYRYHHLFAELLHTQAHKTFEAAVIAQLHLRAADWHARQGSILEAIQHASLAGDDQRLERFIEQHYLEMVRHGEQSWIGYWKGKLSKELVYRRPWLCIFEAYSHAWFGELEEAERLLEQAERTLEAEPPSSDDRAIRGHLAYVRSRVTGMRGDLPRAIEYCRAAGASASAGNLALFLDTHITLGYLYFLSGDYANAQPVLEETTHSGLEAGAVINTVASACLLGRLYAVQGQLRRAAEIVKQAGQAIPATSSEHQGARALVELAQAELCYARDELEAAQTHLQQALKLLPFWDKADDIILAYLALANLRLAQADPPGAQGYVDKANQLAQARGLFPEARQGLEAVQVRVWLAQGELAAAESWAESFQGRCGMDERLTFEHELANLALARLWLVQDKPQEARALLVQLEAGARVAGRLGRVSEILVLQALACQQLGERAPAEGALAEALALAGPESNLRVFLDAGGALEALLTRWLGPGVPAPAGEFARRLLNHFRREPQVARPLPAAGARPAELVDPLTPRELEVLSLIALGCTNQQVAVRLILSPGTVKAHSANIYSKLDAANRTEAVSRARQLGLIN